MKTKKIIITLDEESKFTGVKTNVQGLDELSALGILEVSKQALLERLFNITKLKK